MLRYICFLFTLAFLLVGCATSGYHQGYIISQFEEGAEPSSTEDDAL